jgi:integrase/recombinase XerD
MNSTEEIKAIEQYLIRMGHTRQTIRTYNYAISNFLYSNPNAESYKYKDVLNYITSKVTDCQNTDTKNCMLAGVKKYYDYLVDSGKRDDHPCRRLILKKRTNRDVIHQDLFITEELELLMERDERYNALRIKNQVAISLLIYQGLSAGEIANLKLQHVDLDAGTIYVKESRKYTRRHLDIQVKQYRIFEKYIREVRPELKKATTDIFLVGKLGTPITVDDLNFLVSTFKPLFPDRNLNSKTIRQSVISNWLNEKRIPMEQVQLMAGHRWISATARYRYTPVSERRELINRFHPLK